MKKGVLLLAYGSPESLDDLEAYYTDIRGGRKPSPPALEELANRYKKIGGKSPLLEVTQAQARALQNALGDAYRVYIGMRHWKPFISQTVNEMVRDGIQKATAIVLAPHYSRLSVGQYIEHTRTALKSAVHPIDFHYVESWHRHPFFIDALKVKISAALSQFSAREKEELIVLFTAHSLPERILQWNDPYPEQLMQTGSILAEQLSLKRWRLAYQSAGRTPEPWLGPDLLQVLETLSKEGTNATLVCPIGFIADHLEILYDLDIDAKSKADRLGIHLERTESLNTSPLLIRTFADLCLV